MFDSSLIYPNEYQPRRLACDEDNNPLGFRTYISRPEARYDLFDTLNIICQTKLYRWVKKAFVKGAPIAELHQHLFWDHPNISKRRLGSTIVQAVTHNPRVLVGQRRDNPKACMTYVFMDPKDLEYGLEWMICIWLRRVVLADSVDAMEAALSELIDAKDEELAGLYWRPVTDPFVQESFAEFDWHKLWKQFDLKLQIYRKDEDIKKRPSDPIRSLT